MPYPDDRKTRPPNIASEIEAMIRGIVRKNPEPGTRLLRGRRTYGDLTDGGGHYDYDLIDLVDTPTVYAGSALKYLRVNTEETAVEFITPPFAQAFYLDDAADPVIGGYKKWQRAIPTGAEATLTQTGKNTDGEMLLGTFITTAGVPGTEIIPVGEWDWHMYAHVDNASSESYLKLYVYKRSTAAGPYDITGVDIVLETFTVAEGVTNEFTTGTIFTVSGSTGNDGTYTCSSSSGGGGGPTTIIVNEDITNAVADGQIDTPITTALFNVTSAEINDLAVALQHFLYSQSEQIAMDDTDRLVLKAYFYTTRPANVKMTLTYDGTEHAGHVHLPIAAGGRTIPGGSDTEVQVNDNGVFAGYSTFSYDDATKILALSDQLKVTQSDSSGAVPVQELEQKDVDEPFIKFIGTATVGEIDRSIVNDSDVDTATLVGWIKVEVKDDGDQIPDQDYYMPVYTLAGGAL